MQEQGAAPSCAHNTKRALVGKIKIYGESCLSSFKLDVLIDIEINIAVNHLIGFREGGRFVPVNAFCFENREEISAMALS